MLMMSWVHLEQILALPSGVSWLSAQMSAMLVCNLLMLGFCFGIKHAFVYLTKAVIQRINNIPAYMQSA